MCLTHQGCIGEFKETVPTIKHVADNKHGAFVSIEAEEN